MKRIIIGCLLCLFCVAPQLVEGKNVKKKAAKSSVEFPTKQDINDRVFGLSKVWSELKYNFVNIDQLNFDLDSLYLATIPKVIAAKNDIEYYDVLEEFMAAMNDGHTQLFSPYSWNTYFDYIPCTITEIDGKFYITSIRANSDIDPSLLYAEILEVGGVPVLQYVTEHFFPQVSASTYNHKLMQATVKLMQGPIGSALNGKAKKQSGEIVSFAFVKNGETTRTDDDTMIGYRFGPKAAYELKWEDNVAILEINSFDSKMVEVIDSLANEINQKAKGLVIDLRYNGGGSTLVARHLQMYLSKSDSIRSFGAHKRINDGYYRSQGNYREEYQDFYLGRAYDVVADTTILVDPEIRRFDIPVVIVIGRFSFSACEDFLVNLYEVPDRPIFIGEETGGSTGAPLVIELPHDTYARLCTLRITYPYSGKPFVGSGVKPDIVAKQSIQDYIDEVDSVMERAIEHLRELM